MGPKLIKGVNDLASQYPLIAKEAHGWDPSEVHANSGKKMTWKGKECGHGWDGMTPCNRVTQNQGCPYCRGYRVLVGFNDLKSQYPEIASEAGGWDPETVTTGGDSRKPRNWNCKLGHSYKALIKDRTGEKKCGCPYCAGNKAWPGYNDLQSLYPHIAEEADGWDPRLVTTSSAKKLPWKCIHGHPFNQQVKKRTSNEYPQSCPYCGGKKLLTGFNDLASQFPTIAAEAYGWRPEKVLKGTKEKKKFQCKNCGHIWKASIQQRTLSGHGCPKCAEKGFDLSKPGWIYLLERPGEQQFGISNVPKQRLQTHSREGWYKLEEPIGPFDGVLVAKTEKQLILWLKEKIGRIPGKRENWFTSKYYAKSLADLFKDSGVDDPRST